MNSGAQAYIDLPIYRGLGLGLNCQPVFFFFLLLQASKKPKKKKQKKKKRKKEDSRQRQRDKHSHTNHKYPVEMSPPGDVALATGSLLRHNARRTSLKNVSVQPPWDGRGLLILMPLRQGHSECQVILMMMLMGSNGGWEVSAQTPH